MKSVSLLAFPMLRLFYFRPKQKDTKIMIEGANKFYEKTFDN